MKELDGQDGGRTEKERAKKEVSSLRASKKPGIR